MKKLNPDRMRRALGPIRITIYVVLLGLVGYFLWRFDVVTLPPQSCSPLRAFAPGDRLLVDLHPGAIRTGDSVFYFRSEEELLLGRVENPPPSAPDEVHRACAEGALWIVKDRASCPAADSHVLGPIEPEAIAGRVASALPW